MSIQNLTYGNANTATKPNPEIRAASTVVQQEVPSVQTSNSQIHPSLQIEDELRRTQLETPFEVLLNATVSEPSHSEVEKVLVSFARNPDPSQYAGYLFNLLQDITLLESFLKKLDLPLKTLPQLYFQEKLTTDFEHFKLEGKVSEMVKKYDHDNYFTSRQNKPHLLLAHYSVHVLGLLAGGKILSKMIERKWGKEATNIYIFSNPETLKKKFKEEMNVFVNSLSKTGLDEFKLEMQSSWEYIGDLLDIDIRKQKK